MSAPSPQIAEGVRPWPALWSLVIGFFMILVDSTIVSVANPSIMKGLNTGINSVIWVTSAYLLAYAVPLLITGRLGDRFGPRRLFLGGLAVFTVASALCGLAPSIGVLIAARVLQGIGASFMTPQTMAVITRIFPPERRGSAMAVWGSTAGVAMLVGPIAGGLLVDGLGWEWIFYINVPVGIVGFILAWRFVPALPTRSHSFDLLGVVLSAVGMFLVVFGIQEGETYDWGTIRGPISVWSLIVAGLVVLVGFTVWQRIQRGEPLLPLNLFRDRNFSLGNVAITAVGFSVASMALPIIFFGQLVKGLTPTQSALIMVPMAVLALVMAPVVGRLLNRRSPRWFAVAGGVLLSASLFWYAYLIGRNDAVLWLLMPSALMGLANGFIWAPIANATTRNLPPQLAGAGSGVYNTTRQVGSVLGSASIAALIESRLAANLPVAPGGGSVSTRSFGGGSLPEFLQAGFATAMSQSILLPAVVVLLASVAAAFFAKPKAQHGWKAPGAGSTPQDEDRPLVVEGA